MTRRRCVGTALRPRPLEQRTGRFSPVRRLSICLRRRWNAYWRDKARRAAVVILPLLDDRTLADIGLTRRDVGDIVFGSQADRRRLEEAWRNPRHTEREKPARLTRPC